jgi:hypothetical protein
MQRQELVAMFVAMGLMMFLLNKSRLVMMALASVSGSLIIWLAVVALSSVNISTVTEVSADIFASEISRVDDDLLAVFPRAFFYTNAITLANEHFPLGTGLGSFGGHAAAAFPSPIYYQTGVTSAWWYGEKNFLTDSFWPMPIAESGWLGVAALVIAHMLIVRHLAKGIRKHRKGTMERMLYVRAFGLFIFGTAVSITSPVHVFLTQAVFMVVFVGIAFGHGRWVGMMWPQLPADCTDDAGIESGALLRYSPRLR